MRGIDERLEARKLDVSEAQLTDQGEDLRTARERVGDPDGVATGAPLLQRA